MLRIGVSIRRVAYQRSAEAQPLPRTRSRRRLCLERHPSGQPDTRPRRVRDIIPGMIGFFSRRARPCFLSLALQGGGAHGAFTWGVLDRLLEDPALRIDG